MSKSFQKELPELIRAGILSREKADQIEAYYKQKETAEPNSLTVILSILGALLAGLGTVLFIAHNWDELNKTAKTFFAFLPLLAGQGLCVYTLLRQKDNTAWKECSTVILFFGVASSIALISQIYHVDGTLDRFLLTWMLLSVPLVYIMPSSVVSLLYVGGITWYACLTGYSLIFSSHAIIPYNYLWLLAAILPYYYRLWRKENNFFILHNWVLVLSWVIVLGAFTPPIWNFKGQSDNFSVEMGVAGYLALFCLLWLAGRSRKFSGVKLYANPFLVIGITGILFILFWWSYADAWSITRHRYYSTDKTGFFGFFYNYITIFFLAIALLLLFRNRRSDKEWFDAAGLSVFVLGICFSLLPKTLGDLIVNCWVLLIAIEFIRKGAIQNHLGILNFGLVIIALLALLRFFDDSIPFFWRGLFFLAAGAGFFVANYLVIKKRKNAIKK